MNFSESFAASRGLVAYSPDGRHLASCSQHRLVIRDAASLQILHLHTCLEPVQQLVWSPDSSFVLTAMLKRGIAQVRLRMCVCVLRPVCCTGLVTGAAFMDLQDRRWPGWTDMVLVGPRQQAPAHNGRLLSTPHSLVPC